MIEVAKALPLISATDTLQRSLSSTAELVLTDNQSDRPETKASNLPPPPQLRQTVLEHWITCLNKQETDFSVYRP